MSGNFLQKKVGDSVQSGIDTLRGKKGEVRAAAELQQSQDKATKELQTGTATARGEITSGYGAARGASTAGTEQAKWEASKGYGAALDELNTAEEEAQSFYGSPEIVASRGELLSRVQGKGGFSPEVMEQMKAGGREAFGVGARETARMIGSGGQAAGMTQENLALALADLSAKRAQSERDVDIESAMLAEDQQTGAIPQLFGEAKERSAISERFGERKANSMQEKAQVLSNLTQQGKTELALLLQQQGLDLADLTTDEVMAMTDIILGGGVQRANLSRRPNYLMEGLKSGASAAGAAAGGAG
jgi:hypothetical protein